ncbi:hypothetical protein GI582_08855 [Sulfitobacter sp. BDSS02]|nr:hypothetical protein [Sulfitobacter sp. BDSS02]MBR9849920.1 hypothetical protein [Paracoccaceae bacterium]
MKVLSNTLFFVICLSILDVFRLAEPVRSDQVSETIAKQFFVESYVEKVSNDPLLYLKHLAYFNAEISKGLQNTPQTIAWNRAQKLFEMHRYAEAIDTYFGEGSPLGVGFSIGPPAGIGFALSLDLKPAIVGLSRRFMGLAPLTDEDILKEARSLVSQQATVRGVADALFKSEFDANEYRPLNNLKILLKDLTFQPKQEPLEYINEVFGPGLRALILSDLESLGNVERRQIESDWTSFARFLKQKLWGGSKEITEEEFYSIADDWITDAAYSNIMDVGRLNDLILGEALSEDFYPFQKWWNASHSIWPEIDSDQSSERLSDIAVEINAEHIAFGSMMNNLITTANALGQSDVSALIFMKNMSDIAFGVSKLKLSLEAKGRKIDLVSDLEKANIIIGIYKAAVSLWEVVDKRGEVDADWVRYQDLFWNQMSILEGIGEIENQVSDIQFALGSIHYLIDSSEDRIRADIYALSEKLDRIQRDVNWNFFENRNSQESIMSQSAQSAARTLAALSQREMNTITVDLVEKVEEINNFVVNGVSRPPFVSTVGGSWDSLKSNRPMDDSKVFVVIANILEAVKFYNFTNESMWKEFPHEQADDLRKRASDFIAFYSERGPELAASMHHHDEFAFLDAVGVASDIVARFGPGSRLGFDVDSFWQAHRENQAHWERSADLLPVLLEAFDRDMADLLRIWRITVDASLEKLFEPEYVDVVKHMFMNIDNSQFGALLDCIDESNEGKKTKSALCNSFEPWSSVDPFGPWPKKVGLLQAIGVIEGQPTYNLIELVFRKGNWDECTHADAYCRTNCVKVVGGFAWTGIVRSQYAAILSSSLSFFPGYPVGVREVCHTYPPAGGPTLEQVNVGLRKLLRDIRYSCITDEPTCEYYHDKIFREYMWDTYFSPNLESLFWSSEGEMTPTPREMLFDLLPDGSVSPKRVYPRMSDLSKSQEYEPTLHLFNSIVDDILEMEVRRKVAILKGEIISSHAFISALQHVEDDLWALNALRGHINLDCSSFVEALLSKSTLRISDSGRQSFLDIQISDWISQGKFNRVDGALSELAGVVRAGTVFDLSRLVPSGKCYSKSYPGILVENNLRFLDRFSK